MTVELPGHVRAAIRSGPVPELRDWRALPTAKLTRAERNMRFIERYCIVPEGALVGQPVRLDIFQQAFFYAVYDNPARTREAHLSIARKNSKTTSIGMLVLVHLVGPEAQLNSEIMSGARSREQAGQVYRYASKMVQFSPDLREIVRPVPSQKKLIGLPRNVEYAASSADASTAHGGSPIVAILDELGQVSGPFDPFVDAITTSQGAHADPLLIVISTQAPTDADMFSVWLDDAAKGEDPSIVSHVYEADEDCEIDDEAQWRRANPALGVFRSEDEMRRAAGKAKRMPSFENTFRNLYLNQRVETVAPFVSRSVWRDNGGESDGWGAVYGGLDLSETGDLTALVLISPVGATMNVKPTFWLPRENLKERSRQDRVPYDVWHQQGFLETTPGRSVEYEYVAKRIAELFRTMDIRKIAFDRYNMKHLRPWLVKAGLSEAFIDARFEDFGQGYVSMSPALRTLESLLLNGHIRHGNHPVLHMCAANAVVKMDEAGNRKLDKKKSRGRIDGMVALAMAAGVAGEALNQDQVYGVSLEQIMETV